MRVLPQNTSYPQRHTEVPALDHKWLNYGKKEEEKMCVRYCKDSKTGIEIQLTVHKLSN